MFIIIYLEYLRVCLLHLLSVCLVGSLYANLSAFRLSVRPPVRLITLERLNINSSGLSRCLGQDQEYLHGRKWVNYATSDMVKFSKAQKHKFQAYANTGVIINVYSVAFRNMSVVLKVVPSTHALTF